MFDRAAHIGVHPQKQNGLHWIGVVLPVGKLTAAQMRGLAAIAQQMGDGDIRLTVWQNLLISGIPACKLELAEAAIEKLGLTTKASSIRAGLVACTGNTGCRFAASDTKRHAEEIARWCEARVELDGPVNIHLTGCHHSCAQHYIGDIGLLACKVQTSEDGDAIEGYHILVGGGFGPDAGLARELYRDVKADDAPPTIERMLKAYLARRASRDESFQAFTRRHEIRRADRNVRGGRAMNSPMRPPLAAIVPESAPFTAEQRVWLNGFFAGLLGRRRHRAVAAGGAALLPGVQVGGAAEEDDGAPWHDQTMPLAERMKLAEGRPLRATDDGGDGPAGLRPVRLRLQGLCGCAVQQERGAAEPVRAGRQGNRPHAEGAACRDRHAPSPPAAEMRGARARCPAGERRPLARQSRRSDLHLARAAQQAGLRRKRPGTSNSI